ncbi:FH2 domain-containing protein 1-like [Heptranchias perlo]|uniref:FH2 domain-containing protein 1-like n=1 Tax=Heptranchias perlo TaxID=212740 RepID=UPI00355A498F
MEELFGRKEQQNRLSVRKSFRAKSPQRGGEEEVSILDAKKSMNLGIFLKQFKRPVQSIIDDIKNGAGASYGAEKLMELRKLLPEKEEVKKLREFDGDRDRVSEADLFMLLLVETPSYTERVESMILKEEFAPRLKALRFEVKTMTEAARELMDCDELHTVIRLVLKAGNYMNAGGYAGNAVGFRMASLLKLADTKANKPGMNLMHFVVMEAEKNDKKLMDFPSNLQNIGAASRMFKQETESEFERLKQKLHSVKGNLTRQPEIRELMEGFIQKAEGQLEEVQGSVRELQAVTRELAEYFCEDEEKFKLEECCIIFKTFGEKFLRAREENKERVLAEIKRREMEIKAKRISIATCSHKEKDLRGVDLEFLLLNNYRNSTRQRSPRQNEASIPRSQSMRLIRGTEKTTSRSESSSRSSSPTSEDVRRLREISHRVLQFQVREGSSGQSLKQAMFAKHSRISEESSESVRRISGSTDDLPQVSNGNGHTDGHSKLQEEQRTPAQGINGVKSAQPLSPKGQSLQTMSARDKHHKVNHHHIYGSFPEELVKHSEVITPSFAEAWTPNIGLGDTGPAGNRASEGQALLPEHSPPDLEKQKNELSANVCKKHSSKTLPRSFGNKSPTSSPTPFSRGFSKDKPTSTRSKSFFTRGLSADKAPSSPALRKPSISLSLKPEKAVAANKTALKEEAKPEGSYTWKISNFFSKKLTKASEGESAAQEKASKEVPISSSDRTNLLTNFFKRFSDNKTPKDSSISTPVEDVETDDGSGEL